MSFSNWAGDNFSSFTMSPPPTPPHAPGYIVHIQGQSLLIQLYGQSGGI